MIKPSTHLLALFSLPVDLGTQRGKDIVLKTPFAKLYGKCPTLASISVENIISVETSFSILNLYN